MTKSFLASILAAHHPQAVQQPSQENVSCRFSIGWIASARQAVHLSPPNGKIPLNRSIRAVSKRHLVCSQASRISSIFLAEVNFSRKTAISRAMSFGVRLLGLANFVVGRLWIVPKGQVVSSFSVVFVDSLFKAFRNAVGSSLVTSSASAALLWQPVCGAEMMMKVVMMAER